MLKAYHVEDLPEEPLEDQPLGAVRLQSSGTSSPRLAMPQPALQQPDQPPFEGETPPVARQLFAPSTLLDRKDSEASAPERPIPTMMVLFHSPSGRDDVLPRPGPGQYSGEARSPLHSPSAPSAPPPSNAVLHPLGVLARWLVKLFPNSVRSLEYAAEGGHLNLIKWLIKHTPWDEKSMRKAFIKAVEGCHIETAQFFHEKDVTMTRIYTPTEVASNGNLPMMIWLEEIGCTFDNSFIRAAASGCHLKLLQRLHTNGSLGYSTDVMDYAAEKGHLEIVKFLHVNTKTGCCSPSAMARAAAEGHLEVVKWLHENRTDACVAEAVRSAARNGHVDILKWLNPNRNGLIRCAMYSVVRAAHLDVVQWLYENREEKYPVEFANKVARAGNLDMISWLHENDSGSWAKSTMDGAASKGLLDVVKFLHENRREGCTKEAVNSAAANNHLEVVKWLHANRREGCSKSAIITTARGGHLKMVKWLVANRKDIFSGAAMVEAAGNGHVLVMEFLANNFSVNWPPKAMKDSVKYGQLQSVKWLHLYLNQPISRNLAVLTAREDHIGILEFIRTNCESSITSSVFYVGCGNNNPEVAKWYEDHYSNPRKRKWAVSKRR